MHPCLHTDPLSYLHALIYNTYLPICLSTWHRKLVWSWGITWCSQWMVNIMEEKDQQVSSSIGSLLHKLKLTVRFCWCQGLFIVWVPYIFNYDFSRWCSISLEPSQNGQGVKVLRHDITWCLWRLRIFPSLFWSLVHEYEKRISVIKIHCVQTHRPKGWYRWKIAETNDINLYYMCWWSVTTVKDLLTIRADRDNYYFGAAPGLPMASHWACKWWFQLFCFNPFWDKNLHFDEVFFQLLWP